MLKRLLEKIDVRWRLAKLGNRLIKQWAVAQYHIDGDLVQVDEILNEWRAELDTKLNIMM